MSGVGETRADVWERTSAISGVVQALIAAFSLVVALVTLATSYYFWQNPVSLAEIRDNPKGAIESLNPRATIADAAASNSAKPSFSCKVAVFAVERFICSDPDIAAAEHKVADAYRQALLRVANPAALKAGQKAFLKKLIAEPRQKTLYIELYQQRLVQLSKAT